MTSDRLAPLLLREQEYAATLPTTSLDFQSRVGYPLDSTHDPTPCVLILTRAADNETDELSLALAARGVTQVRLDSDRCPNEEVGWDLARGTLHLRGRAFQPMVCWARHFSAWSMPTAGDAQVDWYMRDQWSALGAALRAAPGARTVNPGTDPTGPDRIGQLSAAAAAGLTIPPTWVTSRPATALAALPPDPTSLIKTLGAHFVEARPGRLSAVFPRRLPRRLLAESATVEPAPVMVQQFVASERELRVYWVGGELISFEVRKGSAEELWTQPQSVEVRGISTPNGLVAPLSRLAARWRLDVAAFDLLQTATGYVFLEVNVLCDWRWFERAAGRNHVTAAVTAVLEKMFRRRQP